MVEVAALSVFIDAQEEAEGGVSNNGSTTAAAADEVDVAADVLEHAEGGGGPTAVRATVASGTAAPPISPFGPTAAAVTVAVAEEADEAVRG